jgi:hypothetical protein
VSEPTAAPSPRPREVLGGIPLPVGADARAQIGFLQRTAELLLAVGQVCRRFDLPLAAHGIEHAAQDLLGEADRQLVAIQMREPRRG